MKKYILYSILCTLFGLVACEDEVDPPKLTVSDIELLVPANNTTFDLDKTLNIVFAWEEAFLVDQYELEFSAKEDMSDPVILPVNRTPHLVTSSDMNDIAAQIGIASGYTGKVYWTVRSVKPSQPSAAAVRSIDVTRLLAQPLLPGKGSTIELDYENPNTEIKFTWEPMPDANYELIISTNADLSDPVITKTTNATSETITHQMLQDVINNPANGLKRYKANTFYWNVKAGDKVMAKPSWTLKVYGMKVFTDVRGSESITYQVSVIPYGDKELIWMAENLRATKLADGTDLVYDQTKGQESWNTQYFPADAAKAGSSTLVPEGIRKHAGMYYRVNMIGNNSSTVQWPSLLAPTGWKVPTELEYKDLAAASLLVSPNWESVRHMDGYPALLVSGKKLNKELMNKWNMNMVPCGTNRIASPGSYYVSEFASLDNAHMIYAIASVSQCVTLELNGAADGGARAIALGYNAPVAVRLMYTGDD